MTKTLESEAINYPDILGLITDDKRLSLGLLHCALATRPRQISAGQTFEILFLVQNAADCQLDVAFTPKLPERDAAHSPDPFYSKGTRVVKTLLPAEVGYFSIPVSCSPLTQPHEAYEISGTIEIKNLESRKPMRLRQTEGGGEVQIELLSEERRRKLLQLRLLNWGTKHQGLIHHSIQTTFSVIEQGLGQLPELNASWETLWTLRDYIDENVMEQRVSTQLERLLPFFTQHKLKFYEALNSATLHWFNQKSYPLQAAEARFIAKLMTHILCDINLPKPSREDPNPSRPYWYQRLLTVLFQEPRFAEHPGKLVQQQLYPELLLDALMHGFKMVETVFHENFGKEEEKLSYATDISNALRYGTPLTYSEVYLPAIMAGVILNGRVIAEGENVRDSLAEIHAAHQKRQPEWTEDNAFIGKLLDEWIDTALEQC